MVPRNDKINNWTNNANVAAIQVLAVQLLLGLLGVTLLGKGHEGKATRATSLAVGGHVGIGHLAKLAKGAAKAL